MKCWTPLSLLIALVCPLVWAGSDAHNLLVTTGDRKLTLVHPDGVQELISEEAAGASFSPDGLSLAYVVWHMREQPKGVWNCDCKLMVMNLSTHATREIVQLPPEASFGQMGWSPDGSAIAYEFVVREKGKGRNDLILAPFPPERGPARNLGTGIKGSAFHRTVHVLSMPSIYLSDLRSWTLRLVIEPFYTKQATSFGTQSSLPTASSSRTPKPFRSQMPVRRTTALIAPVQP